MKLISTLLLSIITFSVYSQDWKTGIAYSAGIPQQEMSNNIPAAHSFQVGLSRHLPGKLKNLAVGIEFGIGFYASTQIEQTFQFDASTSAVLPVNYTSNVFNTNANLRFNLVDRNRNALVPFVQVKGGLYNFYSNIFIEDPDNPDGCKALQQKNIINDATMYWSGGGGITLDPGFHSGKKNRILLDLSVNMIRGGKLDYINTKRLLDAQDISTDGGKPLNVHFINASTNQIHEHSVAQVYHSALRMMEIRFGAAFVLGKQ